MKHWLDDTPSHKQRDVICVAEYASYGEVKRTIRNKLRKAKNRNVAEVYVNIRPLYNILHRFNG